ncbi:hypothetical protein IG631_15835 [Alternaria alternata]|nr:hypothetical protein IG631_15835 [Alternaria alternata]
MGYLSKRWLCYAKAGRWGYQIKGKQASEGAYQPQISLSLLLRTQAAHTKLAFRFAEAGGIERKRTPRNLQKRGFRHKCYPPIRFFILLQASLEFLLFPNDRQDLRKNAVWMRVRKHDITNDARECCALKAVCRVVDVETKTSTFTLLIRMTV